MHAQPIRRQYSNHMIGAQVLEKNFKQAGMAAESQPEKEFIPISEWDLRLQVGTSISTF